jgi:hypothetical protein
VRGYRTKQLILATPRYLLPYLLEPDRARAPQRRSSFEYGAWAVVNLTLQRLPHSAGCPIAWDNVLIDSPSLGYVATSYQRGRTFGPAVLTYYYALCDDPASAGRQRLLEIDREGWVDIALSDLQRAHPDIRSMVRRADVMRWGHAMVRPTVGFIWGPRRAAASRPRRGIHLAHSDLSGLPLLEEAFYRGTLAAENSLQALGRPVQSIL